MLECLTLNPKTLNPKPQRWTGSDTSDSPPRRVDGVQEVTGRGRVCGLDSRV